MVRLIHLERNRANIFLIYDYKLITKSLWPSNVLFHRMYKTKNFYKLTVIMNTKSLVQVFITSLNKNCFTIYPLKNKKDYHRFGILRKWYVMLIWFRLNNRLIDRVVC